MFSSRLPSCRELLHLVNTEVLRQVSSSVSPDDNTKTHGTKDLLELHRIKISEHVCSDGENRVREREKHGVGDGSLCPGDGGRQRATWV